MAIKELWIDLFCKNTGHWTFKNSQASRWPRAVSLELLSLSGHIMF